MKEYGNALVSTTWNHVGHANVLAFLARLGPTFPSPRKLVVAGSSAGGFGALVNYEAFRWYWPDAQVYLVDDSGPALVKDDVPGWLRDAFYNSWRLAEALDPICLDCRSDLSAAFRELADLHPRDRIAFLSHARDPVMTAFTFSTTPGAFEAALRELEAVVFAPTDNARVFYDADGGLLDAHMLLTPATPRRGLLRGVARGGRHLARRLARAHGLGRSELGDGDAGEEPRRRSLPPVGRATS